MKKKKSQVVLISESIVHLYNAVFQKLNLCIKKKKKTENVPLLLRNDIQERLYN